ncbi:OB-fold nucleic acid binding domain-containing protein [Clostridium tarantellae]|uniref:OB domain-containing protein n=1 Tax=Clostridium tarantellae TaxID=39493 RepID=A0A6I1MKG5_9CLOT|nr:hypothetical protein [Clostridium tarantellae]
MRGDVQNITDKKGYFYFQLKDGNNKVECVLFKTDDDILEGKRVRINHANEAKFSIRASGTVNNHNEKIQLVVDKVFNEY